MSIVRTVLLAMLLFSCASTPDLPAATTSTTASRAARRSGAASSPAETQGGVASTDLGTPEVARDAQAPDDMQVTARIAGQDDLTADAGPAARDDMGDDTAVTIATGVSGPADDDAVITSEIQNAVADARGLSPGARAIEITTQHGVVTLRGNVASARERARIDALAHTASGVTAVDDQLHVTR